MGPEPTPDVVRVPEPGAADDRYAALNDAADASTGDWLLFGASESAAEELARALASGGELDALALAAGGIAVRRSAFDDAGGFHEGIGAGGERDLLLRLRALGRRVGELPPSPDGARRWIRRRHGGERPRTPAPLWRYLREDARLPARRALPVARPPRALVVLTDAYPARSETFVYREVAALRELGWAVRVESSARPARVERDAARAGRIDHLEDDPPLRAFADLARLAARHPLRCLTDLAARRRWGHEEPVWPLRSLASAARRLAAGGERHIHVHFAAGAALHALRLARITGITYSVTGHGYDVFAAPRNLAEKLAGASFVVAPCEYTARHLRAQIPGREADVHVVVMGVDGAEFSRARPYPGGRTVAAVGRLVEKKGFGHLVEAAAMLERRAPLERVLIAGDGPLRGELERAIERLGLGDRVEIVEAWGAAPVRELLERADLLAMPSVIAADGDRDAMPVVVKEALAMEIPVVASDEVGLPELVEPEWGRLVSPGDPEALAEAIAELLELAPERRAAMGAAGRAHVLAHCDVRAETAKLAALIAATRGR